MLVAVFMIQEFYLSRRETFIITGLVYVTENAIDITVYWHVSIKFSVFKDIMFFHLSKYNDWTFVVYVQYW